MRRGKKSISMIAVVLGVVVLCGATRADLTDGLIAHWTFDEGSGDVAYDSAGNNDGTIHGAQWADGALDFDGNDDYVDIPYDLSLDIDASSGISISAFINLRSYPGMTQGPIFGLYDSDAPGTKNYLLIHKSVYGNYLSLDQWPPSFGWIDSIKPALDTWYHVVAVQDSTGRAIYINGNLYSTDDNPETYTGDTPDTIRIGNRADGLASYYFDGMIDDVRIYDRVLSAEEAEEVYRGELLGLEITGPDTVAEDFQAQYKAIANYERDDVDVTGLADWSVDNETIAGITAGLLTTEMVDLPTDITIAAQYSEGANTQEAEKEVSIFAICPSGSALSFDGVDDYVEVPDNDGSLDITDSLTISAWVNLNNIEPDNFIANKQPSGTWRKNYPGNYEFRIREGSLRLGHQTGTGGLEYSFYFSTSGIEAGTWHHVAVTLVEGGDVNFYINGSPAGTSPQSGTFGLLNDEPVRIGTRKDTWSYLDGLTDDIRIYNRALSAEEIQAIMHMKPAGADPNLVGYWDFDEGEGQVAGDLSLYGNDGRLGSGPGEDDSDPNWTDSIAPVGICSLEGIVERNLLNILGMKKDVLDILDEAIGKEEALWEYMDIVFKDRNFGNTGKGDVAKAKQKIHSAIQHEEQAESTVEKSIEKLEDALDTLDIE